MSLSQSMMVLLIKQLGFSVNLRIKKNLTIRELCNLTKIDEVSLSTYESGIIEPSVREIAIISRVLNVTSDYILGRIDEETNDLYILNRYKYYNINS